MTAKIATLKVNSTTKISTYTVGEVILDQLSQYNLGMKNRPNWSN